MSESRQLARPDGIAVTLANYREIVDKPLLALPEECRSAVLGFWTMVRRLHPSCLEIAACFRIWIDQHGLRPAEVVEICRLMTAPGKIAGFRFPADVTAELADRVDRVLRDRNMRAEATRRALEQREQAAQIARERAEGKTQRPFLFADLMAGIGQMPKE